MEQKHIIFALTLLVLLIIGMFIFTYLKKNELENTPPNPPLSENVSDSPYAGITRIDAKQFFENGQHTIVGEIMMPTACDLLNWDTEIQESMPETVIINFDVINNDDMCAQVVTAQRFKVEFSASETAMIRAMLEGRNVELNLIPALEGETPDDFEIFIKG